MIPSSQMCWIFDLEMNPWFFDLEMQPLFLDWGIPWFLDLGKHLLFWYFELKMQLELLALGIQP